MAARRALIMVFSLALALPAPLASAAHEQPVRTVHDWIEVEQTIELSPTLERLSLQGTVGVRALNATGGLAFACGHSCSADEMRRLYEGADGEQRRFLTDQLEQAVASKALRALVSLSGRPDEVAVTARAVLGTLEGGDDDPSDDEHDPPVRLSLFGTAPAGLTAAHDRDPRDLLAVFAMGARATAPVSLTAEPGQNLTTTLVVPEPLAVLAPGQAQPLEDARSVRWTLSNWDGERRVERLDAVRIGRPDVVVPERPRALVEVVLDLSEMEGHPTRLLSGRGYASVHAVVRVNASVWALPPPGPLARGLELPALSADAVRIGLAAGLVEPGLLDEREEMAKTALGGMLAQAFGLDVPVRGGFRNASLDVAANGEPLGTGGPLRLVLESHATMRYPSGGGGIPALTLSRIPLPNLTIPRMPGLADAEERLVIVLPPGVDLVYTNATGGDVVRTTTQDGHEAVVLEGNASRGGQPSLEGVSLVVAHPAAWHLFGPWLALALLGSLALAVIGAVLVRRRLEPDP